MQGRLLPKYKGRYQAHPVGYWQEEFFRAKELGLDCIEFILDFNDAEENPLVAPGGTDLILSVSAESGVRVATICADYFMEAPLHDSRASVAEHSQSVLGRLLASAKALGVTDVVIPCVDQSRLADAGASERLIAALQPAIDAAEVTGVNLSLETDLAPHPFAQLLSRFDSARVTANYDTGNSAALGYDPAEELSAYGDRISDIHIKDRKRGGGSVPLGTGDTDFARFFDALAPLRYHGPFILQAYRDDEGLEMASSQLEWFKSELARRAAS